MGIEYINNALAASDDEVAVMMMMMIWNHRSGKCGWLSGAELS